MAEQYWIGSVFVDPSRNQITANGQPQTLAPKAMAVLTYLAQNCGKVVTQEEILTQVWPDTVVSPNTLQKSIAQLRKALGDDGKVQIYIKTHAKQGYSLESDVRWSDTAFLETASLETVPLETTSLETTSLETACGPEGVNKAKTVKNPALFTSPLKRFLNRLFIPSKKPLSFVVGITILAITAYLYLTQNFSLNSAAFFTPQQTSSLTFDHIRLLTATDDKEFDATYTPDGKYIVFHRYLDKQCVNRIWAKNTNTQEEILLTKDWGAYGRHSFSKDGKRLVFLAQAPCTEQTASQKQCFDLANINFEKALKNPQSPEVIVNCENSTVRKPTWLNNNNVALLQHNSVRGKLISFSLKENKSTDLFNQNNVGVIDYAYSSKDDLLAAITRHNNGQHYIEMFKPDGSIVSTHPIEYPQEISQYRAIHPSFTPLDNQLIFSTGRQLFTLAYDGKITKINTPFANKVMQPEFHPNGKKLLLIKGPYDSDIGLQPLDQLAKTNLTQQTYTSFARSNLSDSHANFQPEGNLIAFWSNRSGDGQLWVSNTIKFDGGAELNEGVKNNEIKRKGAQQLTHFPVDSLFGGFDWAHDGNSILVNTNYTLTQVFLDSTQKAIALKYPVLRLYQWDSKNNTAIVLIRIGAQEKMVEYDLVHSEYKELNDKIRWALKSDDGQLIYKDQLNQFWQPGPMEAQRIKALDSQQSKSHSFVVKGNVIFDINSQNQLWSYDLDSEQFNILAEVNKDIDELTDINQTHLLMTYQVSAKKEVIEVSVRE